MSLIKCPECGQEISDKAKMCPHCGYELAPTENGLPKPDCETVNVPPTSSDNANLSMKPFSALEKKEKTALYNEFDKRYPKYPRKSTERKTMIFTAIALIFIIPVIMIIVGVVLRDDNREHFFDDRRYDYVGLEGFTNEELQILCELHDAKKVSYEYHNGNTYLLYDDEIEEYNNIGWPLIGLSIGLLIVVAPFSIAFGISSWRNRNKLIIYETIFQAWLARDKHIEYKLDFNAKGDKEKIGAIDLTKYPF